MTMIVGSHPMAPSHRMTIMPMPNHSPNALKFLKLAAICSFLGALTTALLIFLPNPEVTDFDSRVQLHRNSLYLTKLWILFLHPQVNFIASLGIVYLFFRKYPLQMILGTLFLGVWAYTEMSSTGTLD